jgi:hypothetical protein
MFILPTDIRKDDLGISKIMKISLRNLNDIKINRKKLQGSGIISSYFSTLKKRVVLGHFPQYRAKG